jgi:HK97 gp10 family phage protein
MIKLKIKGLDDVLHEFSRYDTETRVEVRKVVKASATRIRKAAQGRVPVDTGEMKKRIRAKYASDGLSAEIAPQSSLAHFVEFGTVQARAQPFMAPTAEEERPKYLADVEQALKQAVRSL